MTTYPADVAQEEHNHHYTHTRTSRWLVCACGAWMPGAAATPADEEAFARKQLGLGPKQ